MIESEVTAKKAKECIKVPDMPLPPDSGVHATCFALMKILVE